MKSKFTKIRGIVALAMLPLVATAAASAQQWISDSAPGVSNSAIAAEVAKAPVTGRMHTVALNKAGAVEGRVARIEQVSKELRGLGSMNVFFVQNGKVVKEAKTSNDGTFVAEGLAEGVYSFVASGTAGFVAYGVKVVGEGKAANTNIMEAVVVSANLNMVQDILSGKLPKQVLQKVAASTEGAESKLVGVKKVVLDGKKLHGRLSDLVGAGSLEGMVIQIMQEGKQIAEVIADKTGAFSVEDLEPGVYEFVASGSAGFAAISFEAIGQIAQADSDAVAVSFQDFYGDSGSLDVGLAGCSDCGMVSDSVSYGGGDFGYPVEVAGDSFGMGGACGGSCGSCGAAPSCGGGGGAGGGLGGRLFGGRGLGRLLLLGAAVAIPLATSNPSTTSPSS